MKILYISHTEKDLKEPTFSIKEIKETTNTLSFSLESLETIKRSKKPLEELKKRNYIVGDFKIKRDQFNISLIDGLINNLINRCFKLIEVYYKHIKEFETNRLFSLKKLKEKRNYLFYLLESSYRTNNEIPNLDINIKDYFKYFSSEDLEEAISFLLLQVERQNYRYDEKWINDFLFLIENDNSIFLNTYLYQLDIFKALDTKYLPFNISNIEKGFNHLEVTSENITPFINIKAKIPTDLDKVINSEKILNRLSEGDIYFKSINNKKDKEFNFNINLKEAISKIDVLLDALTKNINVANKLSKLIDRISKIVGSIATKQVDKLSTEEREYIKINLFTLFYLIKIIKEPFLSLDIHLFKATSHFTLAIEKSSDLEEDDSKVVLTKLN